MPRFIARHSFFSACADKVIEFHLILHFTLKFKLKMRGTVRFCDVIYRRFPGGGNPYRLSEKECSWINFHIENKYENLGNTEYLNFIPFFSPNRAAKIVDYQSKEGENRCRTPDGRPGKCDDLSNCPSLLLDLTHLRESLCFKSLFVPGVCCPISENTNAITTTQRPLKLTTRATTRATTRPSLFLNPVTTSTQRPLVPVYTVGSSTVTQKPSSSISSVQPANEPSGNFVDSDDCGQQEYSSGRIVGGVEAPTGQWPWLAAIFLHGPKRTEFWCVELKVAFEPFFNACFFLGAAGV